MALIKTHPERKIGIPRSVQVAWQAARSMHASFRNRRRTRLELGNLSQHYLRDLGMTRGDIFTLSNSWGRVDAADRLARNSRARAGNW